MNSATLNKAHSKYIKWPILPKVKETHFKIINKMYPVSDFLKRRFKFEVDLCYFCNSEEETVEHLFYSCPVSQSFWSDIENWVSLKMSGIPSFELHHIMYYMDTLDVSVSDIINIVLLLGKYHIHCAKWRNYKPSFPGFINYFKLFFSALASLKSWKIARKLYLDIGQNV